MAKFDIELPNDLIKQFQALGTDCKKMFEAMTQAGAEVVYKNVIHNMRGSFKDSSKLEPYLRITKKYTTKDGSINTKVAFYGYYKEGERVYRYKRKSKEYSYKGIPVPLIVRAREFGSSSGEQKKPFFRKSFRKSEIEKAMLEEQKKFLPKE